MEQLDLFSLFAGTSALEMPNSEEPSKTVDKPTQPTNQKKDNAKRTTANATSKNGLWSGISEQTINDLLLRGSGFENGKKRIIEFFEHEKDETKRADMLKKEYGIGGFGRFYGCSVDHDGKGYRIRNDETNEQIILSWRNVAERIGKLIHYHLYYV